MRLTDVTKNAELGYATVTGTTFSGEFTLDGAGSHRLRARVVDQAGNVAEDPFLDVFVDLTAPGVSSVAGVTPNPRNTPVSTLDVVLDEPVDLTGFTYEDLSLTRRRQRRGPGRHGDGGLVSGNTYRISGLDGFTGSPGDYQLTVSAAGLTDRAGNAGVGQASTTWTMAQTLPTGIRGVSYEDLDGDGVRDTNESTYRRPHRVPGRQPQWGAGSG